MKKTFVEPAMKVIRMTLNENIAASGDYTVDSGNIVIYHISGANGLVIGTYSKEAVDAAFDEYWGRTRATGLESAINGIAEKLGDNSIKRCLS